MDLYNKGMRKFEFYIVCAKDLNKTKSYLFLLMESLTIKLEKNFLQDIEKVMKKKHYSTKTEFVREALREKLTKEQKEEMIQAVDSLRGVSSHKTHDDDLHKTREKLAKKWEEEFS